MNIKRIGFNLAIIPALVGLSLTTINLQAEENEKSVETIEIHVEQENGNDALIEVIVNGVAEKFVLADLADGESRSIISDSGKNILASKDNDGNTVVTIDGKELKLFDLGAQHGANFSFAHTDAGSRDFDMDFKSDNKIMVLGSGLNDEIKAALQATLHSFSPEKELVFPGGNGTKMMFINKDSDSFHNINTIIDTDGGENKEIKIIKRKIKVSK